MSSVPTPSTIPVVYDDLVADEILAQLRREIDEKLAAKDRVIAEKDALIARNRQALALSEMKIRLLMEEIRLERIKRYGKRSEKLSDLQLELLDLEP